MKRASKGYTGVDTLLFQTMLVQGQILQGDGSTIPVESHHTPISAPSTSQPPTSPPGGSIAQTRSERVPTPPHDSPLLRVNTLGSDEGSMTLYELTVKKLEQTVKTSQARRRAKIVVSDDEEDVEDSSKQGRMIEEIDQDAGITLVTPTHNATKVRTYSRRRRAVSITSGGISTAEELVSTIGASIPVSTTGMVQGHSLVLEQERLGLEAAMRLQEQFDEEERQRITREHEEASSFNIKEWENIQTRIEANEEIAARQQTEERQELTIEERSRLFVELMDKRKKYFAEKRAEERRNKPLTQA
ncbi:hypothetical protein Tco_0093544 [Tanacetum coccineum]